MVLALGACVPAPAALDAGCDTYAEARLSMPRLPDTNLGWWVAITDSRMTGACR